MKHRSKKKQATPEPIFPIEFLFPGTHAKRPDIAAREAEQFLAYGHKLDGGFDPHDPQVRGELIDVPPDEFGEFKIKPLTPDLQKRLDALPADWESHPAMHAIAYAITAAAAIHYALPAHLCCILENKEIWVWRK